MLTLFASIIITFVPMNIQETKGTGDKFMSSPKSIACNYMSWDLKLEIICCNKCFSGLVISRILCILNTNAKIHKSFRILSPVAVKIFMTKGKSAVY